MSVLPILTWPDARLSQPCAPCQPGEATADLAQDMLDTMYDAPGRGLAAPQVGVLLRLFVMDVTWKEGEPSPQIFVNPEVTWASAKVTTQDEGCLSIPGVLTSVSRPAEIDVSWQDLHGVPQSARFDGFAAACIQHEIDHLDGIVTFDRLAPDMRADALSRYRSLV